jgi:hypothetical protein
MSYQPPRDQRPKSVQLFTAFLAEGGVQLSESEREARSLADLLESVFDRLDEAILRSLVGKALEQRNLSASDESVLGPWSDIIDGVRGLTITRRERASSNFERLVTIGRSGDLMHAQVFISELYECGQLDRLFIELVGDALSSCERSGQEEFAGLFRYFSEAIARTTRSASTSTSTSASEAFAGADSESEVVEQRELMRAGIRLNVLLKVSLIMASRE